MIVEDAKLKINSVLRQAGLNKVPKPIIVIVSILLVIALVFTVIHFWPTNYTEQSKDFEISSGQENEEDELESVKDQIAIDIEGAVNNPGLYYIKSDERLASLIELAGGFRQDACRATINLASKLEDGSQIYITTPSENWNQAGYIWVQQSKVHFGLTNADGTINKSNDVSYP
ncbi:MAG: SLBB domain-containing protein, partial [Coriobacteriales bacterium]|nr:SLBB domain-containing protein [Coriobacteriales bacterium]